MKDRKAMLWKILLCEGPKSYVLQCFVVIGAEKLKFVSLAILWTEKLFFARFCYVMDQKAILCKILVCDRLKSYVLGDFGM